MAGCELGDTDDEELDVELLLEVDFALEVRDAAGVVVA
jgi:hypothetical protein